LLPEPASAQFQKVTDRGTHVCGEVNGRAASGGYTGYTRFIYAKNSRAASLEPRAATPLPTAPDAACSKPAAYQSVDERFTCAAPPAGTPPPAAPTDFDSEWRQSCD
jgi:hypothetical protein